MIYNISSWIILLGDDKTIVSSYKRKSLRGDINISGGDRKTSTTNELVQVLREQAHMKHGQGGYGGGISLDEIVITLKY